MKFIIICFICFPLLVFTQNSESLSIVSVEKLNVVYRGIANPIKIAVPNIPSDRIAVSAPGLTKGEGEGNYVIIPGSGREITVYVSYTEVNGMIKTEKKIFRVKNIPKPIATINGYNCERCIVQLTKQELLEGVIEVSMGDFLIDIDTTVRSFTLTLPDKREIRVNGDIFDEVSKKRD